MLGLNGVIVSTLFILIETTSPTLNWLHFLSSSFLLCCTIFSSWLASMVFRNSCLFSLVFLYCLCQIILFYFKAVWSILLQIVIWFVHLCRVCIRNNFYALLYMQHFPMRFYAINGFIWSCFNGRLVGYVSGVWNFIELLAPVWHLCNCAYY